jgi:hypothetical protein
LKPKSTDVPFLDFPDRSENASTIQHQEYDAHRTPVFDRKRRKQIQGKPTSRLKTFCSFFGISLRFGQMHLKGKSF